ncbi:MAG: ABC transporter permease [Lentisphaerae bacterium]|nr:MAG: ABC transporter permease [Lentisphaerota bacterium]
MKNANLSRILDKLGPFLALIVVFAIFAILGKEKFCQWGTINDILTICVIVGITALGATMVIISGGIDLSVGCTIAAVTVIVAHVLNWKIGNEFILQQHPVLWPLVAATIGVAWGGLVGLIIGLAVVGYIGFITAFLSALLLAYGLTCWGTPWYISLIAFLLVAGALTILNYRWNRKIPLPPFIVTLGLWTSIRGLAKWFANGSGVYPKLTEVNGQSIWLNLMMTDIKLGKLTIPMPGVWIWLFAALCVGLLLRYTRFGRHIYAIGSNEQTARLCGINVPQTRILIYLLAGLLTGLAGVLRYSWLGMGDPTTDIGTELFVIASVVIGGASLTGGSGGILGTVIGTLIIMIVYIGCTVLGLRNFVQEIVTGAIIIFAVALDQLRHSDPTK